MKLYLTSIFSYIMSDEQRHETKLHYHHKLAEEEAAAAAKRAAAKAAKRGTEQKETTAQEDIDKLIGRDSKEQKT